LVIERPARFARRVFLRAPCSRFPRTPCAHRLGGPNRTP
jgi:hypothetical protein